jgi:predicted nucleic-acid-binding protein
MGVASVYLQMFLRKLKNRSGSTSIQIISKASGKYRVLKTIGCGYSEQEIEKLKYIAKQEIERLSNQPKLFVSENDTIVEQVFSSLSNASIKTVGPELVFGTIYDNIGFGVIKEDLFRHLVIARLAFPLSKLKTIDYLYRFQGVILDIDSIYRFLDKLNNKLKDEVEQIVFRHTQNVLMGDISVVFYDMTTLYFEASDEDDLRKTGFNKDGKYQNPQIF